MELHKSFALIFDVLFAAFFILLLHISPIITILGILEFVVIKLVVLAEFSPGFEVVPVLIESVNFIHRSVHVTEGWNRLNQSKSPIVLETWSILFEKVSVIDDVSSWNFIIEREG